MHITSGVMDMTKLKRGKYGAKKRSLMYQPTVGEELHVVEPDQNIRTEPEESKRRRTIILRKDHDSWGFTVHTYGIHHKTTDKLDILTYVDYVSPNGPAYVAGMRAGDVILAINGISMETADHTSLVNFIKTCETTMRLIVLFEDCCHKVELHSRYIKLQTVLRAKIFEIRSLERQETLVLEGKSRVDPRRLSLASSCSSSMNGFWDDRLSLRPEYDICPMHGTSPVLPKHNSGDTCSLRMASSSSASLCSCEFGNVSFMPAGRLSSQDTLRSSFSGASLGSGRRHPDSSTFLRNTSSLDRADFNRQKRPRSLNLSRPISSYDLKFPAIEELELKTYNSASAVASVSERVQAKSALSRNSVYSSCHSNMGSSRRRQDISPLAAADGIQRNNGEIHQSSTDPTNRCGTAASPQDRPSAATSHKSLFTNVTMGCAVGSSFTRSIIYQSTPHRLRKSSKLTRSSSHISEFKGSPMLLSIKPLMPDLPLSSPGGSTDNVKTLSCTASNSLRYSRNLSSRNDTDDEFSLTDSPLLDSVFPSPSHPFPGPLSSTPRPLASTPPSLASTPSPLTSTPVPRNNFPCTEAHKPFTCHRDDFMSHSAKASVHCNLPMSDLCSRVKVITLRRDQRECGTSRIGTSDYFSMVPSVTGDTDNWYLACHCHDRGGDGCDDGCDSLINSCSAQKQQNRFVFYKDLSLVQLEFVNEKDEDTAL